MLGYKKCDKVTAELIFKICLPNLKSCIMTAKNVNVLVSEKQVCPIYNARNIAFSQHKIDLKRVIFYFTYMHPD